MSPPTLAAVILTYNETKHIAACIEATQFADFTLVVDSYSQDDTVSLALAAGAEVIQNVFNDYADQRNVALRHVVGKADWVLFVDADERVTPELAQEIRSVIIHADYAGWRIPRYNYIFGKLTQGAGWYPDYQTRLLRVGSAHYDPDRKVHEVVILDGELGTMNAHFVHHNYDDVKQFITKQRKYTSYEAQIMFEQGTRPKPRNFILQPLRQFKWRFLELRGFSDGFHGFRLSMLMAWFEYRKYVILRQLWQKQPG